MCLRNSNEIRTAFLSLLPVDGLAQNAGELEFHTQYCYRQHTRVENDDEEQSDFPNQGRFDILVRATDFSFVIVIFVKVVAVTFYFNQLGRHFCRELEQDDLFKKVPRQRRLIVTITKNSQTPSEGRKNIRWSQIQELLALTDIKDVVTRMIVWSFSQFLKEKGIWYPLEDWTNESRSHRKLDIVFQIPKSTLAHLGNEFERTMQLDLI